MNLLIADDHTLFRDAIHYYIQRERPDINVTAVADVYEAEAYLNEQAISGRGKNNVDIILLDLLMPGMNGMQGLRRIKLEYPDIPLLLMSGVASEDDVQDAISLGCAGYFPKTLTSDLLLKGLDLVIKGEKYIPIDTKTGRILSSKKSENWTSNSYGGGLSETANDIHDRWVQFRESSLQEKHRVIDEQREHEDVKLTKREKDVLSYLVKGEKNKDIADALGVKTVTIKLHVRSICRKFGVKNRTQAALRAREVNI